MTFTIKWLDGKAEPKCKPNPDFPRGIDLDLCPEGTTKSCRTALPYPARRVGSYVVTCRVCGIVVSCTTAGRPDDPKSMKVPCKIVEGQPVIFKMQRALMPPDADVLVYDQTRTRSFHLPLTDSLRKIFGQQVKIYVEGTVERGKLIIANRVSQQPW